MRQIQQVNSEQITFHERLQHELSSYPVKTVQADGSVIVQHVQNSYFLISDSWGINFLKDIPQFQEMVENYTGTNRNVHFQINSPSVSLEVKYVWHQKLFREEWALGSIFNGYSPHLKRLAEFLNQKYPALPSLLDLDIDRAKREWWYWLERQGVSTQRTTQNMTYGEYTINSHSANFLQNIHSNLFELTDTREEWEKDRWDVRVLQDTYGIAYVKSMTNYYVDFTKIGQLNMRWQVKKYIKQRLLSKNNFSWGTAQEYLKFFPQFFSFIFSLEPTWNDLIQLKRSHLEKYIEWLHSYANSNVKRKDANPARYISERLHAVGKFLEDIQRYEYDIAPETHVRLLLFPEDKPKRRKKSIDQIDYIPDFVLEQLFTNINDLHEDVIPVIRVAFKTGLRISDVLGLTSDCLERLNGKYSIVTDIEKTYVLGHRIPIDDELANILAVLIQRSKENSNQDNNPEGFIFVRYRGSRKGKPYSQKWIQEQLNILAKKKNIVDENGNLFHFKTHQFRHTYAVKMLNGGADILTVKELLAHASPEMTLRYAILLDDTKRKAFESVINQGVFSFDLNGEVQKIKEGEDIPQDILQALWQDHKLNAMDNPYGTCHARLKGDCPHMEAPPCLTCNGGSPCKDLAIGFSELDVEKYEMHVKTTSRSAEVAKQHGRDDMAEKHERNLQRYKDILSKIQEGNIIFGRQNRVKRKPGVTNV
ncbi:tyrosine-type recombinase/integrase [Bacillus sp. ISL-18]|uniref:tyrosine-type recombinase/integrase n=1 Tax=Bacillus sp. ISL-18 TaxID=2819118 RepID=UPI001BE930E7|nr:site-specific integrase [Bacillus sp. ISL-18]MBT2655373.1 tyrosine-type recombinase/integrase [Bacillus sp. ISL-18]